jgi:hypothetical protein
MIIEEPSQVVDCKLTPLIYRCIGLGLEKLVYVGDSQQLRAILMQVEDTRRVTQEALVIV